MKVDTLWDISKGLPDTKAWYCNSSGEFKKNGNYIAWPKDGAKKSSQDTVKCCIPGGPLAAQECFIAKVYLPYQREAVFEYKKFKEFPVDLLDKLNKKRIERKIARILQNIGVAYVDRAKLLFATNSILASAWFTNFQGKEGIALNPWVLLQSNMQFLTRLVKKEVIHRALYRNLGELSNKVILNFTLDVLAMRIIAQTPYEKLDKITVRLAEKLFNPELYKKFPLLVLTDCSLTYKQVEAKIPGPIAQIWCELYKPDDRGFLPSLRSIKPSALYFKIKSLVDEVTVSTLKNGIDYPFNVMPSAEIGQGTDQITLNDNSVSSEFDKKNSALNSAVKDSFKPRKFKNNRSYSNQVTEFWEHEVVKKKDFVDNKLKEFAKKWRTEKVLEDLEGKLQNIIGRDEVEIKPYAEELTYDGTVLMALGFSSPDAFPLYWNQENSKNNNRKKVVALFDLSSSMQQFLPYMVRVVESIEESCDVVFSRSAQKEDEQNGMVRGAYGFAGKVVPLSEDDLEKMKNGHFKCSVGTSFENMMTHIFEKIEKDDVDIVLCFTDGKEGGIRDETVQKFNDTGKRMYPIYMTPFYGDARDDTQVHSDLDKLNGESFTLCLPPTEVF